MIHHIDVGTVLRRTVCDLYSDLVTRPTGAAVRSGIEQQLSEMGERTLTIIDFSRVGLLDFSCADEIVAKLLLRYCADRPPREAYFLFRGVNESHLDAIETVLERHNLAIVAETLDGSMMLVGRLDDRERRVWEVMCRLGRVEPADLAREAGLEQDQSEEVLHLLYRRRLVMRYESGYIAIGAAT